jgi:hypothetical protein
LNQTRILILLFVLLAFGAAAAWLLLTPGGLSPRERTEVLARGSALTDNAGLGALDPAARPAVPASARVVEGPATAQDDPAEAALPLPPEGATDTSEIAMPEAPASPATAAAQTAPAPARELTPREREEQRRVQHGRPALAARMARLVAGLRPSGRLSRSADRETWDEQWREEGLDPPPMVPTHVQGKVMSEQSREGLGGAVVGFLTFFPAQRVAGGSLLPVLTELQADEQGNFKGEIPASELPPKDYPAAALCVNWQGLRVLTGVPVAPFEAGRENHLGIYWAPQTPYFVECDATQFQGDLRVVTTGGLNPQRWHSSRRAAAFSYFPGVAVTPRNAEPAPGKPAPGFARLVDSWPGGVPPPYLTLLDAGEPRQTRMPQEPHVARLADGNDKGLAAGDWTSFEVVVFTDDATSRISGVVLDGDGRAVSGAVVSTLGAPVLQSAVSDTTGWFLIERPHDGITALRCTHHDFVETVQPDVTPGDTGVRIVLALRRPRIHLHVRDRQSGQPLPDIGVKVVGLIPHGPDAGKPAPEQTVTLESGDGHFLLEWPHAIQRITLERLGYFPRAIADPAAAQEAAGGVLEIALAPGRTLSVRPRDYTAVRQEDRFFADGNPESPGIRTYWAQQWIEWRVDFGDEPEAGEQGGRFDLLLGCTNWGIVDNQYEFLVDVYVDGERRGRVSVLADSVTERFARMALGPLSGEHTIRLNWLNDKWIPDQLDANIRYATLQFLEQP